MKKKAPNIFNQTALLEEIDQLKLELEKLKQKNALLEQQFVDHRPPNLNGKEKESKLFVDQQSKSLPISIWESDYSSAYKFIQQLKGKGITDLSKYFNANSNELENILKSIRINFINNIGQEFINQKQSEITLAELVDTSNHPTIIEILQAIQANRHWINTEIKLQADTGIINLILQMSVTPGYEKDYSKVVIALTDITERVTTRSKLQKINRQLSTLISNLKGVAYRCKNDSDWTMHFISNSIHELTGYHPDELVNNRDISYADIIHPDDVKTVEDYISESIKNHERFTLEYRVIAKNGQEKWVWEQGIGIPGEKGEVDIIEGYISDITDRKMMEIALRESEEKFKKAFQASPTMIILSHASDGKILETNESFDKLTGWTKEESQGRTTKEIGLWANSKERTEYINLVKTNGAVRDKEYQYKNKTGEIHEALVSGHLLNLQQGEVIIGVLTDITEQKRYAINLANERALLRTVIETIPDLIWLKDPNGVFLNCNYQFEKLFGVKESEILGKTDYDFVDKELADFFKQKDQEALSSGESKTNLEWVTFASNGKRVLMETIKTPMHSSDGKLIGILGISRDITEYQKNQEALRESENLYKGIFNNTGTATCIIDEDKTLVLVNDKFQELSGYSKSELENKMKWTAFVLPEDLERMKKYHSDRRKNSENSPKQYEITFIDNQHQRHNILVTIDMIPDSKMSVASLLDITARVNAVKQLIQAKEEAENADRLKSSFLATMSHELRTPLNAIIGFSQLIEPTMKMDEIMEMVGIINNSGNHLLSIIESIFEIAMLQSKQTRLRINQFELKDLLTNLNYFVKSEIEKNEKQSLKNNTLNNHPPKQIILETDETKLTQVLSNLLSNSIKYSEEGVIELSYSIHNSDITFVIRDDGIGISKKQQKIIFDWFRQIDDTSTRKYGGVGLGLAICKEISELLDGELWVESELGKGSKFFFKIPNAIIEKKLEIDR